MSSQAHNIDEHIAHHHDAATRRRWLFVVGLGIVSLALGTLGFLHGKDDHGTPLGILDALYQSMRLFHMHYEHAPHPLPWELQIARFLSPLVLGITLVKGFILVAHGHRHAFLHRAQSGHIVICGLGEKGLQLALDYRKQGKEVVVIEKDASNELLKACNEAGVFYWIGDAVESAVLEHACVTQAQEIIVLTPDDETNVRIAIQIQKLGVCNQPSPPKCFVHLENIHLCERMEKLFEASSGKKTSCAIRFFDVYDCEARRVLMNVPLDGNGIGKDDPRSVHVVILGFGRMGRSVAVRAAKMGHFANGKKLRISVVDRAANNQREHFLFRYPAFEQHDICTLTFHQTDVQSHAARNLVLGWAAEPKTLLHLFVCLDENSRAVETGLRFQEALRIRPDCNLHVRIKTRSSLAEIFDKSDTLPLIRAFGMVEDSCCRNAFIHAHDDVVARATHEQFVRQREADSIRKPGTESTLLAWDELMEEIRESNRQQADHIGIKLRAVGCEMVEASDPRPAVTLFARHEIDLLAETEHTRWNTERWLAGWRYGTPSNRAQRINENLAGWNELDDSVKDYDRQTVNNIPTLLQLLSPPRKVVRKTSEPD